MRKRVYEIIEPSRNGDGPSLAYDIFMLIAITASIVPLMFVEDTKAFRVALSNVPIVPSALDKNNESLENKVI